jgi:hypothetical protein
MGRISALLLAIAALSVISTVAEAADGCGRGWYYNGRRCVPMDEPGYGYRGEPPPVSSFKTWNNCPPNFTVQDGLCKPYRGR